MIGCVVCEGVVDFGQHWRRMVIERFGSIGVGVGCVVCEIVVEFLHLVVFR